MNIRISNSVAALATTFILAILSSVGLTTDNVYAQFLPSTTGVAILTSDLDTELLRLKNTKRKIGAIIRGKLNQKAKLKGEGIDSDAELEIKDNKKLIRQLNALTKLIFQDELSGEIQAKTKKKFEMLFDKTVRQRNQNERILNRMNNFYEQHKPVPPANFRGHWNTNFGQILFINPQGNKFQGTYSWSGGGVVNGQVNGQVFKGTYRDGNGTGTFKIIMFEGDTKWSGSYKSSDGNGSGAWSGTLISREPTKIGLGALQYLERSPKIMALRPIIFEDRSSPVPVLSCF